MIPRNDNGTVKTSITTAAGILFIDSKTGNFLIQHNLEEGGYFEDLGGKTEKYDRDAFDTAAREAAEEMNGLLFPEFADFRTRNFLTQKVIREYIKNYTIKKIYIEKSKYMLFIVKLPYANRLYIDFGIKEVHTNIPRQIGWSSKNKLIKLFEETNKEDSRINIHPRLNDEKLFKFIYNYKN